MAAEPKATPKMEAKKKDLKDQIYLGATVLVGLFFLLLGLADLLYVNDAGLKFYYYGRGIGVLLFGLAIILYPFKENPSMKLGAISLTILAAYFLTLTYLYDAFTVGAANLVDFILFTLIIRMYIPLITKIEDEFHRTVLDVIIGGVLLFYLLGRLVFPFTATFGGPNTGLALNGLVTQFITFNAVPLTLILLPGAIAIVLLRLRFIGGFIGLILGTRNKELAINRIKVLKKFIGYLFLATLFIVLSYSAHRLYVNMRDNARAKIAVIGYILYDLSFFIYITYDLAESLYKRC